MKSDPTAPLAELKGGIWLQRATGLLAALAGMALALLVLLTGHNLSQRAEEMEAGLIGALLAMAAIGAFLVSSGWRMLFNLPNRHGSALTPATWYIAAVVFILLGVMFAFKGYSSEAPLGALQAGLQALAFSLLSACAGWRAGRKGRAAKGNVA